MRRLLLMALATIAVSTAVTHAAGLNIPAGEYNSTLDGNFYSYNSEEPQFRISKQGNKIALVDIQNSIRYLIDLSKTEEQELPKAYINFLHTSPFLKTLGSIVDHITVNNLQLSADGNSLLLDLNIYISHVRKSGGTFTAKVRTGAKLTMESCEVFQSDQDGFKSQKCLAADFPISAGVPAASLGGSASDNSILAEVLDIFVQALAPSIRQVTTLVPQL